MKEIYGTELVVNGEQVDIMDFYTKPEEEEIKLYHYWNKEKEVYGIGDTMEEAFANANREYYLAYKENGFK